MSSQEGTYHGWIIRSNHGGKREDNWQAKNSSRGGSLTAPTLSDLKNKIRLINASHTKTKTFWDVKAYGPGKEPRSMTGFDSSRASKASSLNSIRTALANKQHSGYTVAWIVPQPDPAMVNAAKKAMDDGDYITSEEYIAQLKKKYGKGTL